MPFENVVSTTFSEFVEMLSFDLETEAATPLFTVCNQLDNIVNGALAATKREKEYKVYLLTHPFFSGNLEPGEYVPINWQEMFTDFCNFFDRHRFAMTSIIKLQFTELSSKEHIILPGLPRDQKIILIVENFNLWDKNSQLSMAKIPESNNNVQMLAQIRSDFEPAIKHVDAAAANRGQWVKLIEKDMNA